MILAKDSGTSQREKPTAGMHDAVCVFVEDVGMQKTTGTYGDKIQHKIIICWELDEKLKDGKFAGQPFMVSSRYTLTLFEKGNLCKILESWFAKKLSDEQRENGIDLEKLIGKKCTLNLIESAQGYINVGSVLPANAHNTLTPVCTSVPEWIGKLRSEAVADGATEPNESTENLPF